MVQGGRIRSAALALIIVVVPSPAGSQGALDALTTDNIRKFSPRAASELVDALVTHRSYLRDAEISTPPRLVHFLTQLATETGGLRRIDENLSYSAKRLTEVFSRVSREKAKELAGRPVETANYVYGDILGNLGRHTNDGWDYRGSGFIQLTGRYNFRKRGNEVDLPLEARPDIARRPQEGLLAATAYWTARQINAAADADQLKRVRVLVNGKRAHGYEASKIWYRRAQSLFVAGEAASETGPAVAGSPTTEDLQSAVGVLRELGFLEQGSEEAGVDEKSLSDALKAYQKSRGLRETGTLDEDTLYEITDPREWKTLPSDGEEQPPADTRLEAGSQSLHQGISYDIQSGASSSVDGAALPTGESPSDAGSGILSNETSLSQLEMDQLAEAAPLYPSYEQREGIRDRSGDFIPYSVIEPDTREVVVNTTEYPSRAIVQISFVNASNGKRYSCTGGMIGANFVLTAGHCVHDGGPGGGWHRDFVIYPGRNGPLKPFGSCSASQLYSVEGWVNAASADEGRLYDIGAIKLDCDIGRQTGWLRLSTAADSIVGTQTMIQGYPCDKTPAGKAWVSRDEVRGVLPQKLFYQNDTYGCMSGAPVFTDGDQGIVGVHTNGLHGEEPWNSNNAGTRITETAIQDLRAWMGQ
jgi:putative chitinase